jgi:ABC-type microcin C transport system permease subunit YejE
MGIGITQGLIAIPTIFTITTFLTSYFNKVFWKILGIAAFLSWTGATSEAKASVVAEPQEKLRCLVC